jgi:Ca2+-binding EF-hand superfamily protein
VLQPASEAEIVAFRNSIYRTFGNLTRAFYAMKTVASSHVAEQPKLGAALPGQQRSASLTANEFEWCVTSYLRYSDRLHARRMFLALDHERKGEVGLIDMKLPSAHAEGLLSMADFRGLLLDRHTSLPRAFHELEDALEQEGSGYLDVRGSRIMRVGEFAKATAFLGLEEHQAIHLFNCIDSDGNGSLTFQEFMEAMISMPRETLLKDFRRRILAKYATIANAFQELASSGGMQLPHEEFVASLAKIGITETEAELLFRIIDQDSSGDVSIDELREAVREVSPDTDLESFWKRFDAEWPEILAAISAGAGGDTTLRQLSQASVLLSELVMSEEEVPVSPSKRLKDARSAYALLSTKDFDFLAARLDVSRRSATELWALIVARAPGKDGVCYVEDFLEQLHLWAGNPLALRVGVAERGPGRDRAVQQEVLQVSALARATLSKLKAELEPEPTESSEPQAPVISKPRSASAGRRVSKTPKLPWCAHFAPSTPSSVLVC